MRYFLYSVLLLVITNFSFGQHVERYYKESAEHFVNRFMPEHSKLSQNVLETKWNAKPVIIALFNQDYKLSKEENPDQQNYSRMIGEIFFKAGKNGYTKMIIDTIESEGGDPTIESVFFANADNDNSKELIVLVSWPQVHADVSGTLYATYISDDLIKYKAKKLQYLKIISQKLSGGCECDYKDDKSTKATFKNEVDIKSKLRSLGYR
jgi:hypothetical protein